MSLCLTRLRRSQSNKQRVYQMKCSKLKRALVAVTDVAISSCISDPIVSDK